MLELFTYKLTNCHQCIIFIPKHNTGVAKVVSEVGFGKVYCGSIHNNPSYIKINPCGGVVDDDKVREKSVGLLHDARFSVCVIFFDAKLRQDNWVEKMLMPGGLPMNCKFNGVQNGL
jgi:hypothetical protein